MGKFAMIAMVAFAATAALPATACAQEKSTALAIAAPDTVNVGASVTISGTVTDAWTGQALPGRLVQFGIGQEFALANAGYFNTNGRGSVSFTWRWTRPGRYRIVAYFDGGGGYLSQRTLKYINVR